MGIITKLFGRKQETVDTSEEKATRIAFILLSKSSVPDADAIAREYGAFAVEGESIGSEVQLSSKQSSDEVIGLRFSTGEKSFVALMPTPIPNGEAEYHTKNSLSTFGKEWTLPPHQAHMLVTFHGTPGTSPLDRLSRFTSLLAATVKTTPAVGVYWGDAGATHEPEFFLSVAAEHEIVPRLMLWSGVSIARLDDGRLSLLSLGMNQLDLPDLLLDAGPLSESVALETMFDLLAYVAERGKAVPDGDTVGRTAEERLTVTYVTSPVDPKKQVWHVALP